MKQFSFGLAIWLTAASIAASAQAAAPDEAQQEKKICRTERATGSLTRQTRICMTEAQWRELSRRNKQGLDEFNRSASGSSVNRDAERTFGPGGMDQYTGSPNN